MNVVLFSPHFPDNFRHFSTRLKEVGVTVLAISDVAYEALHIDLQSSLSAYYQVENMHAYDQVVRACGYFISKYGKIDRFESHNEYWLELDARIRTDFNIPGIKTEEIFYYKKKSLMKELFIKAGIPCARGKVVPTYEDAVAYGKEIGFPIVIKPDIGVGASHTYKLHSNKELFDFFTHKDERMYIMEEFIDGSICSFDGLVNKDGTLVFHTGHQYSQGIMETVNEDTHVYYYSFLDLPEDLYDMGLRILEHFNVRERFFHFEFFRMKDGRLIALEVNMRPPGGLTIDMFNYASNIDIYKIWADVITNEHLLPATPERQYHCCYIGRKNRYAYIHTHDEILNTYKEHIVYHEPINSIFGAALGHYGYLVRSTSLDEIVEMINYIHKFTEA